MSKPDKETDKAVAERLGFMLFDEWLTMELSKPVREDFNCDGNSSRAVLLRGKFGQFLWCAKRNMPRHFSDIKREWDGWDTPIAWFVIVALFPIYMPITFITWPVGSYRRALNDYKSTYNHHKKYNQSKLQENKHER